MEDNHGLKQMVCEDISRCEEVWKEFSHDKDKMEELFQSLLFRYAEKIDDFTEDMWVISSYEGSASMAETYRENIKRLLLRLQAFQDNGYQNEGLRDYYLIQERKEAFHFNLNFSEVRIEIGMLATLSTFEKDEIIEKLGEIEEICAKPISRAKKWDMLRGHIIWLSGKDVAIAMKLLPLFLNIE